MKYIYLFHKINIVLNTDTIVCIDIFINQVKTNFKYEKIAAVSKL